MTAQAGTSTGASNIVYDLVSIQYHALKGAQVYEQYLNDARECGIEEITSFIQQVQREDQERARRVHELLGRFSTTSGNQIDLTQQGGQGMSGQGQGTAGQQEMAGAGAGTSGMVG